MTTMILVYLQLSYIVTTLASDSIPRHKVTESDFTIYRLSKEEQ